MGVRLERFQACREAWTRGGAGGGFTSTALVLLASLCPGVSGVVTIRATRKCPGSTGAVPAGVARCRGKGNSGRPGVYIKKLL